ncbi:restriction endonuclease subunit S [Listeria innocua]|nr:restriction endonuclease subunit S [Listeria innocua]EIS4930790.1 restriction endonuclease subunit S [Listeria innocua]EIS4933747.1 restriction endonuclease subunit S [Listeria innocua]EIS4942467.1 restriction endonuclease subunit S [Listeria innocua]EIS4945459.1 restriction endonuclease subunit S [Listeria innocua]
MKKLEKSVPIIRFKGFYEAWEQRKLGDHAKYRRGSFPQPYGNKEWYDGEGAMPFVQVVDVTSKLTLVENTKQKISKLAQPKSVFVPKGKVIVTLQGSIGRIAITQYDSFVDRTLLIFDDYEKETDERFWAYTIQKKFEIEKLKAPGGTIKTITKEALSSFDVHLPQFEEQQKIGILFKQLDDTIALHQRKLEALKLMKKGFLQQMFPKSEEDVPKIRFTDFNGNWRQCKLEEVADRVRGNDRRMELPTLTISASKGWLNQHERFFGNIAGKEQKNYTLLKKGQLSYNHGNSKSAKYGAVFVLRTYDEALVPRIYHSFKTNILANSDFIEYLFATKIPDRELGKIVSSGARMDGLLNINFNDFMSILIMLPFVEEQMKISNFLIRLDKIISLYQNKLDQLIKLKKAYLQYLFI